MTTPDVLVVGGGIVGAAVARALAAAGHRVEIVDSGAEPGIATQASAGMLAPLVETHEKDALIGLTVRGRDLYGELAPVLREETGVDVGLWLDGVLRLAFTEAEEAQGRGTVAWHRQQGFNSEWLSAGELRDRCPGLSPEARGALLAPEDGAVDPLATLEALLVSAARHGTRLIRGEPVIGLETDEGRVTGVRTRGGPRPAGAVVIAAGAWSGRLGGLPRPLSVEPVRGQMLAYPWPADEPPAIVFGREGYVVRRGAEALVGSTMEFAGFDPETTDVGRAQLEATAAGLYPALAATGATRSWTGLRPCTPDGYPIIGPDSDRPNLWYATGHCRNGVLLAAVTGEIITHLVGGNPVEQLEMDLTPVRPSRFWRFSVGPGPRVGGSGAVDQPEG
jgi:glycine oxidase